jgi:hypothetical protein
MLLILAQTQWQKSILTKKTFLSTYTGQSSSQNVAVTGNSGFKKQKNSNSNCKTAQFCGYV